MTDNNFAYLSIEMDDGTMFRWKIIKKFAWKLVYDRWQDKEEKQDNDLTKNVENIAIK